MTHSKDIREQIAEILEGLSCQFDIGGERYDQRRHKGVPPEATQALESLIVEAMIDELRNLPYINPEWKTFEYINERIAELKAQLTKNGEK